MKEFQKRIIAIVGMAGSGKSVLAAGLRERGLPVVRFGQIIVDEVARKGLELTPENEQLVREELRQLHGMDACAQLASPVIDQLLHSYPVVIIDGLYSLSEYKTLSRTYGELLMVVAVFTPKELRYERLALRAQRPLTRIQAVTRDWLEIEKIEKGGPIALADFTFLNDGPPEELLQRASELLALN